MAQLPCAAEGGPPVSFLARIGVTSVALALGKGPRLGAGPLLVRRGRRSQGWLRRKRGGGGIAAGLRRVVRRGACSQAWLRQGRRGRGGLRRGCAAWYGGERAAKHGCDKDGGDGASCGGIAPRGTEGSCLAAGLRCVVRRGAILRRGCSPWYGGVIFGFGGESG